MASELSEITDLNRLVEMMKANGVRQLMYKRLAPNDNSKNQIYLGGNYSSLELIPFGEVTAVTDRKDSKRDRFKAELSLYWLNDDGCKYQAPTAQLILYPKYPEVRLSGFLKGCERRPSGHLASRDEGRILFIGVTDQRKLLCHVIGADNPIVKMFDETAEVEIGTSVFHLVYGEAENEDNEQQLKEKLKEIADMGWLSSRRLNTSGDFIPYKAGNGGGYTLEAMFGIIPNGLNEPDFMGWELKQHSVSDLTKPLSGGPLTLMTPEPTGGIYKDEGVIEFVRRFGYPDTSGKEDRFNFGGVHKFGIKTARTELTLHLAGFDFDKGKIDSIEGGIHLVNDAGVIAASWGFGKLLEKWNRKHSRAAYIPSNRRQVGSEYEYCYGTTVALGKGTNFGRFLHSMAAGQVYYDPGIKVEQMSSERPQSKRRSQFRIKGNGLHTLYDSFEVVKL